MRKITLLIFALFLILPNVLCQEEDFFSSDNKQDTQKPKRNLDKWSFGGNFWISFGSNSSYVELSPIALYKAHPRLLVGPGFTYIYEKYNYYNFQTSTYGPRVIATYTLLANLKETINLNIGNIILHSEYEYLNIEMIYETPQGIISDGRTWVSNVLVGGGIFQPLGTRGGISIIILYNLIDNRFSPYSNPIFRVGFFF